MADKFNASLILQVSAAPVCVQTFLSFGLLWGGCLGFEPQLTDAGCAIIKLIPKADSMDVARAIETAPWRQQVKVRVGVHS